MSRPAQLRDAIEILLVEDSPSDRLITLNALKRAKILNVVNTVEDGVEATNYLRRLGKFSQATRPDLILLDLNLPRKDGRQVLAEIKADPLLKFIPVVVMTTSQDDDDVIRAYEHHANGFITKPVDQSGFHKAISALGRYWFEVVTLPAEAEVARHRTTPPPRASRPAARSDDVVNVLLIEDNPSDVLLLMKSLYASSLAKFAVTTVQRLSQAREHLALNHCDIILTDLGLPETQGIETYRHLKMIAPELPIVVLTGLDDETVGMNALHEGAQDYLVKGPLTGRALARAIRYAIDKSAIQAQLMQSQRLEAVGQLAGGVAHDFNNVLGVVQGHASLLLEGGAVDIASSAREILQAVEHAARLTRQLLTFSRKHAVSMVSTDLSAVIGNFSTMLRRVIGSDVGLELQLSSKLPPILADSAMLEQIILNLALNARDAMPRGGKLTLHTAPFELEARTTPDHPNANPGHFACLSVSDTGEGMSAEVARRIWEPFFTTKEVGKGSGLGLATVHGIVQQHRGWITVDSTPMAGTSFKLYFPATTELAVARKFDSTVPGPAGGAERILLVEDNDPLRFLTKTVLELRGYHVTEARSAVEALHLWHELKLPVDLLITDLVMPEGKTGIQLAAEILRMAPDMPVIFISGYSADAVARSDTPVELKDGYNFLEKPFATAKLLETVRARRARTRLRCPRPRSSARLVSRVVAGGLPSHAQAGAQKSSARW